MQIVFLWLCKLYFSHFVNVFLRFCELISQILWGDWKGCAAFSGRRLGACHLSGEGYHWGTRARQPFHRGAPAFPFRRRVFLFFFSVQWISLETFLGICSLRDKLTDSFLESFQFCQQHISIEIIRGLCHHLFIITVLYQITEGNRIFKRRNCKGFQELMQHLFWSGWSHYVCTCYVRRIFYS